MVAGDVSVLGIDLGTAVTRAAVYRVATRVSRSPTPIAVPTAAALRGAGEWEVVSPAEEGAILGLKRLLGRTAREPLVQRLAERLGIEAEDGPFGLLLDAGGRRGAVVDAVGAVLRQAVERAAPDGPWQVVFAVPCWFDEPQRQALRRAADAARLDVLAIVTDLGAAASWFVGADSEARTVAVVDAGAGGFSAALFRVDDEGVTLLTCVGSAQAGGDDLDAALTDPAMVAHPPALRPALWRAIEGAKRELGERSAASRTVRLPDGKLGRVKVERDALDALAHTFAADLEAALVSLIASTPGAPVAAAYVGGGMAALDAVQSAVVRAFGCKLLGCPEYAVVTGATAIAGAMVEQRKTRLVEVAGVSSTRAPTAAAQIAPQPLSTPAAKRITAPIGGAALAAARGPEVARSAGRAPLAFDFTRSARPSPSSRTPPSTQPPPRLRKARRPETPSARDEASPPASPARPPRAVRRGASDPQVGPPVLVTEPTERAALPFAGEAPTGRAALPRRGATTMPRRRAPTAPRAPDGEQGGALDAPLPHVGDLFAPASASELIYVARLPQLTFPMFLVRLGNRATTVGIDDGRHDLQFAVHDGVAELDQNEHARLLELGSRPRLHFALDRPDPPTRLARSVYGLLHVAAQALYSFGTAWSTEELEAALGDRMGLAARLRQDQTARLSLVLDAHSEVAATMYFDGRRRLRRVCEQGATGRRDVLQLLFVLCAFDLVTWHAASDPAADVDATR